jgi:iron complex outermembrane receptor protein
VEGASRPGVGDWKWSAGIQYQAAVMGGTLTPRFDVSHISGYCGNLACSPIASNDGYTLANARLTYNSPDDVWKVSLEVSNLFDKYYYINKFVSSYALGQPGRPREWAVTLRRNF